MNKDISVFVACHKPSVLPDNPLYVPIHVGRSNSVKPLNGMIGDDTGDNISVKNPMYCELSAQYWAWKNCQSEYIGLCHYRRLFCFNDKDYKKDLRNQIVISRMDGYTMDEYGLTDEATMRQVIEANDVVVGLKEDVSSLATPYGPKPTVMGHWLAHDRALIRESDLKKLLEIVKTKYPEIYKVGHKVLNDKYFVGYNCFVMRKDLFDTMCAYEFDCLKTLEESIDLTGVHTQIHRIYGFMGEILFDMFVFYLESLGQYRIQHVPLLYVEHTDLMPMVKPKGEHTIVIDCEHGHGYLVEPLIQSLIDHLSKDKKWQIIIAHNGFNKHDQNQILDMVKPYDYLVMDMVDISDNLIPSLTMRESETVKLPYQLFYPYLFKDIDHALVLSWHTLVNDDLSPWFDHRDTLVTAVNDMVYQGKINDIYPDYAIWLHERGFTSDSSYFNAHIMALDFDGIRHKYTYQVMIDTIASLDEPKLSFWDGYNLIYENDVTIVPFEYGYQPLSNDYRKYQIPFAPYDTFAAYGKAKHAMILDYDDNDPWYPIGSELDDLYWHYAAKVAGYHTILAHMMAVRSTPAPKQTWLKRFAEKQFPKNSRKRAMITKVFPKRSKRRAAIKKLINE